MMKIYFKIVLFLLILSLIWVYLFLNLIYVTYFQETFFCSLKIGVSTQFALLYILGILISMCYLGLILFKKDK
jgi:hypothetical protein